MRGVPLALCLLLFAVGGCRSPEPVSPQPPSSPDDEQEPEFKREPAHDPVLGPYWIEANKAFVDESCHPRERSAKEPNEPKGDESDASDASSDPKPIKLGDPPSTHVIDAGGGVMVKQHCGLVFNEIASPELFADFVRGVCHSFDGTVTTECSAKFMDMFIARLGERYIAADWSAISLKCRAYPLGCQQPIAVERIVLESHNAGVRAWYTKSTQEVYANIARQNAEAAQIAAEQARATEQRSAEKRRAVLQAIGAGLQGMGQAMAPPPTVHCTSMTIGNTTNTNCR